MEPIKNFKAFNSRFFISLKKFVKDLVGTNDLLGQKKIILNYLQMIQFRVEFIRTEFSAVDPVLNPKCKNKIPLSSSLSYN